MADKKAGELMAERIRGLSISLDLDTLGVDRKLSSIKRSFRDFDSSMKTNMNNFRNSERSTKNYEKAIGDLTSTIDNQKNNLGDLKKQYDEVVKSEGAHSKSAQQLRTEINRQADNINYYEHQLGKVTSEFSEFQKQQDIANSKWTKFGDGLINIGGKMSSVGGVAKSLGDSLTKYITAPAVAATSALVGISLVKGIDRLTGIDTAKAKLMALGHDGESVEKIMENALNSVKGTSFGLGEAASTAASAVAAGVEPGKELERYLKLSGDAAAVAGVDINEMGAIFNKVQTSNKIQMGEMNQLLDRGIPIVQMLAEQLGVSAEEVTELASKGEISSEDFLNAVENGFGGAAKVMGENSITAALANMWAALGRVGANFLDAGGKGGGFFSQMKPILGELTDMFSNFEGVAASWGEKLGAVFAQIIEKVREGVTWFNSLESSQKKMFGALALGVVAAGPLLAIFGRILMTLGNFLTAMGPIIKGIKLMGGAFAILTSPVSLTIGAIVGLGAAFVIAYKKSETFRNFIGNLKDRFMSAWQSAMEFKDKITGVFSGMFSMFKGDWLGGRTILQKLGMTPEQILGVENFVLGIQYKFHQLKEQLNLAFTAISTFFKQMLDKITAFWQSDGQQITEAIKNAVTLIKNIISVAMPIITTIIGTAFKLALAIVKMVWDNIKGVINGALDIIMGAIRIFSGIFTGDFSKMWEGVKQIFSGAIEFIWNLFQLMFWGRLIKGITSLVKTAIGLFNGLRQNSVGIFQSLWNTLVQIWSMISQSIVGFIKGIFNSAKTIFTTMWTTLRTIFTGILNTGRTIWNTFSAVTRTVFSGVRNFMSNIWTNIKNTIVTLVKGLWAVVRGVWNVFSTVTSTIFRTLWNTMTSIFRGIYNSISNIVKTLWNAVRAVWLTFRTSTGNIFSNLRHTLTLIWNNILSRVTNTVKTLWNNVRNTWNTLRTTTSSIFNNVKSTITGVWTSIKSSVTDTVSKMWTGVKNTFNTMKNGITNIIDDIKDKIGGMTDKVKEGINSLIDGINWVAGKIGMDELPKIKLSTGTQQINRNVSTTYDGKLKDGTFATVGDKGPGNGPGGFRQELIQYPNGKTALTPAKDTFTYLPKGSRVINGRDTYNLLNTPRFSMGTKLKGFGEAVGNKASEIGSAVKDAGSKAISAIGDVFDYVKNPGKLVDLVFKQFGFNFDFAEGSLIKDLLSNAYSKIKESVKNLFTGWLDMGGSGGDGSSFTKFPVTTPYSPNSPVPGYPRNINNGHHYGIDYATPSGTTLTAPTDGTLKQLRDVGGGIVARLINGQFTQFFMHLSSVLGSGKIKQGEPFARTGNSGKWTTGAHLHYQVEKGHSDYVTNKNTVDPDQFLRGITGGGAAATGSFRPQIAKALQLNGLPTNKAYIDAWSRQVQSESSGNPRAVQRVIDINSGGNEARGLVQVIPPTFNAYKHPGMNDIYNPLHNLAAGINYAKNRYGKSGMLSVIGKGHGYENGGILQKAGLFLGAEGNKEEAVIPLHKPTEAMKLLAIVGKKLAGKGKQTSQLPSVPYVNNNSEKQDQIIELLAKQNQILMKLLGKKSDIYMDSEKVGSILDERNAINSSLQF